MTTLSVSATALTTGALATYRVTRLMTTDTITEPIRAAIWNRYPPETNRASYILTCEHCSAVYAGAAVALLAGFTLPHMPRSVSGAANMALATLALSGAVSLYLDHTGRA